MNAWPPIANRMTLRSRFTKFKSISSTGTSLGLAVKRRGFEMNCLIWISTLLIFQTTLARAYYDPYGGYGNSYSRYGSSPQNQVISLDFDQKDILNSSFRIAARE